MERSSEVASWGPDPIGRSPDLTAADLPVSCYVKLGAGDSSPE
jgi:hypothetical protein